MIPYRTTFDEGEFVVLAERQGDEFILRRIEPLAATLFYMASHDGMPEQIEGDMLNILRKTNNRSAWHNLSSHRRAFFALCGTASCVTRRVVDTRTDKISAEVPLANFPKQFEVEVNFIYVNVPEANHVAVVDRKKKAVAATWPVKAAKGNLPMGFDRARHRLFIGWWRCNFCTMDNWRRAKNILSGSISRGTGRHGSSSLLISFPLRNTTGAAQCWKGRSV